MTHLTIKKYRQWIVHIIPYLENNNTVPIVNLNTFNMADISSLRTESYPARAPLLHVDALTRLL